MNFKERLEASQKKIDEIKGKINETSEAAKNAGQMKKDEIQANIKELDAQIEEFDKAVDAQIESDIAEMDAAFDEMDKAIEAQVEDDIATVQGEINAAKENIRLAKERGDSKINSIRLRAQMNVNAAKAKITEKKEAHDKAEQEQRIINLLDYADRCQELALALALESEASILEAASEAADYMEKYGESK